jgi:hypothetical protein
MKEKGKISLMRISSSAKYALGVTAAVAILAGCSSGGSQLAPAVGGQGMSQSAVHSAPGIHADGKHKMGFLAATKSVAHPQIKKYKQWMEKNANKNRLLYSSDFYANVVQVYNYPSNGTQNPPAGTMTGFVNPQGICVDKAQNVYIANTGSGQVLEYAHGGTTPINTYNDPNQFPVGCSVNPMTGEVAVGNIFGASSNGSVTVFSADGSTSTNYADPSVFEMFFPGYDSAGNLFIEGEGSFGVTVDELPSGGSSLTNLALSGVSIGFPGNMMADGTNLAVGDQSCSTGNSCSHGATSDGSTLTGTGVDTNFGGSVDVPQAFLKRGVKGIVGCDALNLTCDTWAYPAGGSQRPNKHIVVSGAAELIGAAVSAGSNS